MVRMSTCLPVAAKDTDVRECGLTIVFDFFDVLYFWAGNGDM